MSEWVQNCNEFGGPSSPNLEECLGNDDGCGAFKEAKCDFDQTYIIIDVEDLLDPEGCQSFCDETPNCEFFYHDSHYCTLYSKRSGHCDVISGPFYPKYNSCQESSVTTTTESAPSGIDTIIGSFPRQETFVVSSIFDSGLADFDANIAFINLTKLENFLGFQKVSGLAYREGLGN